MATKQQIADAAAQYLHSLPKAQASLQLSELATVLTDKIGEKVHVPDILHSREALEKRGVTLVNYSNEDMPLAEPTDRRTRAGQKTKSEWSLDLGDRVKHRKQELNG